LLYCAALEEHGEQRVHRHVGREPSGRSFNELALNGNGLPHNPMINAGAIMTSSLIRRDLATADRLEFLTDLVTVLSGNRPCHFNNAVWHSERETADRNFALAHHMRERGAFPAGTSIPPTLDYYFSACSIEVTSTAVATIGATFANGGVCPVTGERVFGEETVKNCLSMMSSCGMYDYSGEFAFTVGIPAKSSVSGVILAVIPNVMGIAVWSPRLDNCGNSVRGVAFLRELIGRFSFHNYDSLVASRKEDPRRLRTSSESSFSYRAIQAASIGDVTELRRLIAHGHDLNLADYDGRTPLHLACAEDQHEAVRYLLDQGVASSPKDRWGTTPLSDARKHKRKEIVSLFAKRAQLRETAKQTRASAA
jgi:glutaminase